MTKMKTMRQKEEIVAYLLLLPIFCLFIFFMYYPPLLGVIRSFFTWSIGKVPKFVGIQNYTDYFQSTNTDREIQNMGVLLLAGVVRGIIFPLTMAELLFHLKSRSMKNVYKRMVMLPMVVPVIVAVLLWKYIYDPALGPINLLIKGVGLEGLTRNWLGDPRTALYSIMFVGFPWVCTLGTLIFLGGLLQIPESFFESALMEGASSWKILFRIEMPLIKRQFRLQMILTAVYSVTQFNHILVMTDGGPGFTTMVPGLSMYKRAFLYNQYGMASGIGFLLFLTALALTILINLATSTKEEY